MKKGRYRVSNRQNNHENEYKQEIEVDTHRDIRPKEGGYLPK